MRIRNGLSAEYAGSRMANSDPYGSACYIYAEEVADFLEPHIEAGLTPATAITDHREAAEASADAKTDGITGSMYGEAGLILARHWVHGEEWRIQHNLRTQLHHEGERANTEGTILNPAVLTAAT